MPDKTLPPRDVVAEEHQWNAASVFESDEAWAVEFDAVEAALPGLAKFKGHLGDDPPTLADGLEAVQDISRRTEIVYMYAFMCHAVDLGDQQANAMLGKADSLVARVRTAVAFLRPEMLTIGQETLLRWMAAEPRLVIYAHFVDDLFRQQAHVRSPEVEEVLGMVSDPFSSVANTADVLVDADFKFAPAAGATGEQFEVAQGSIDKLLADPDRDVRRTAWENYADTYLAFKNTLSSNLAASIKQDVFFARARHYASTLEAALFEQNIPPEVFYNLIETCRKHIPTWHRYWAVRRRALAVDKLYPYDIWAPLTDASPPVAYEQAVDWIYEGLKPLGDHYASTLHRGCLEQRWVDIYPNQGKMSGAFSYGAYGTHPFINMSFVDNLQSMSTLAHELGHSMHSYLSWESQPYVYADYSLFVAEVASNFNQAMVRSYLLANNPDPGFQIALIEEAMDNIHRYFFIMPTLARFELETHERVERGEGLTADSMIELMADLFAEGYGDEMTYDRECVGITWAQFGHLYAGYYVFQYATGISAAHALANRVLSGEPGAAEDYLKFLSAGSSTYPLDALKLAGVDLTTPQPVEETFAVLADYVSRLETLTAKKE